MFLKHVKNHDDRVGRAHVFLSVFPPVFLFLFCTGILKKSGDYEKFIHHDGNISLSFSKLIYLGKYG